MNIQSRRRFRKQINMQGSDCRQKDRKDYLLESTRLLIEGTAKLAFWSSIKRSTYHNTRLHPEWPGSIASIGQEYQR
jgi:hypothetical protein